LLAFRSPLFPGLLAFPLPAARARRAPFGLPFQLEFETLLTLQPPPPPKRFLFKRIATSIEEREAGHTSSADAQKALARLCCFGFLRVLKGGIDGSLLPCAHLATATARTRARRCGLSTLSTRVRLTRAKEASILGGVSRCGCGNVGEVAGRPSEGVSGRLHDFATLRALPRGFCHVCTRIMLWK